MTEEDFSFDLVNDVTPDKIIENSLQEIEKSTRGYVSGHIATYGGPIHSYSKEVTVQKSSSTAAVMIANLYEPKTETKTVDIDIQDSLGAIGVDDHKFEVFLTVKGMDKYKYRMMFVEYTSVSYPVTIVMNDDLVAEYSSSYDDTFELNSVEDVKKMMDKVINSNMIRRLIQSLISEAVRIEKRNGRQ